MDGTSSTTINAPGGSLEYFESSHWNSTRFKCSLEHRAAHALGHLVYVHIPVFLELPMLYGILTMLYEKILYHVTVVHILYVLSCMLFYIAFNRPIAIIQAYLLIPPMYIICRFVWERTSSLRPGWSHTKTQHTLYSMVTAVIDHRKMESALIHVTMNSSSAYKSPQSLFPCNKRHAPFSIMSVLSSKIMIILFSV